MKRLRILYLFLLLPLLVGQQASAWTPAVESMFGGGYTAAAGCADHVVEIAASASTVWSIGDGTTARYIGQTFTPGNAGTITSIGYYSAYSDSTSNRVTMRWKHRTGSSDYDLASYIDSIQSGQLTDVGWVDYNVTDTVVGASDLYMIGLAMTVGTGAGAKGVRDGTNPYAGGIGLDNSWEAAGSWNLSNNEDLAGADLRMRYTICY